MTNRKELVNKTDDRMADRLRHLRAEARKLNDTVVEDLRPFRHNRMPNLFRRLPDSASKPNDANVTTSCTNLMALCANNAFDDYFDIAPKKPDELNSERRKYALTVLQQLSDSEWQSSGLRPDNTFTTTLVLRTAGFLAQNYDPSSIRSVKKIWKGRELTLEQIAREIAKAAPSCFGLQTSLRENPALGYWLVDGADSLQIDLGDSWTNLAKWSSLEFTHQFALVSSGDDALMDPVSMAMAACLCERLRSIASKPDFAKSEAVKAAIPARVELERGIHLLFKHQEASGIWDKFFPMFYYRDDAGGANYCFAFEFLEAILNEFGASVCKSKSLIIRIERALSWCKTKRLQYIHERTPYRGWNSAQQLDTVQMGKPESWATGVVHMFLHRLCDVLSDEIQSLILDAYQAVFFNGPSSKSWDKFMTPLVDVGTGKSERLKDIVDEEIITLCEKETANKSSHSHLLLRDRPRLPLKITGRRSGLLFGPPGTSKTTFVRSVAERLNWPYIEITPSHFLRNGLGGIYEEANKIFEDLMDLSGVVILFDEMDALVQRRDVGDGRAQLDVTRQFLTTSMLPKLAKLNDNAASVYFMATNHKKLFDDAIVRPGRFDLLLCMGPPAWSEKRADVKVWINKSEDDRDETAARIVNWVDTSKKIRTMLNLFTFNEMKAMFDSIGREYKMPLKQFLDEEVTAGFVRFSRVVRHWFKDLIVLRKGSEARKEYDKYDLKGSRIQ